MATFRRQFAAFAAVLLGACAGSTASTAQGYPTKPVRIVVGFAPGGSTDIAARLIGQWLTDRLGKQFVIENRPGAATGIAAETVVRAPPDGHTLLLVSSADAINATLHPKQGFVFMRDIAPVASLTQQPQVLMANPAVPAKTFAELIDYVKTNPGKVNIASAGNGSISHLAGELLKMMSGMDMLHLPYRGSGPALTDLLAGHVQISFAGMAGSIQHLKSGRLRAMAVSTGRRSAVFPDVPAIAEHFKGYEAVSFFGIGAPRGTPVEIVDLLNGHINAGLADSKIEARFVDLGGTVLTGTPAAFGQLINDETEKWGRVIKTANIKSEDKSDSRPTAAPK